MADKKLTFRQKSAIKFVDQEEPAFIKQIKAKMGYREPATIDEKFKQYESDDDEDATKNKDDIRNLTEEERPQIVVIDSETDISSADLDKEIAKFQEAEDKKKIEEGQVKFRKPEKRPLEKNEEKNEVPEKKTERSASSLRHQNAKLLSFNDEEEED